MLSTSAHILARPQTAMAPATHLRNATTDPVWPVGAVPLGKLFKDGFVTCLIMPCVFLDTVLEFAVCSSLRMVAQ